MSLYEEALVEAKKLKQIAEEDAKQAIMEDITPFIREMISKELAGKTSPLFEEVDPMTDLPGMGAPVDASASAAPVADPAAPVSGAVVGGPSDAPIKATGADALNMPMPGPDGKLVVDFDDLFVPSEPGDEAGEGDEGSASASATPEVPGGMPSNTPVDVNPTPDGMTPATGDASDPAMSAPPPGEGEGVMDAPLGDEPVEPQLETYEMFSEALDKTAKQVHKAYSSNGVPSVMKEALFEKLYSLIEGLESLTEKQAISNDLANIFENRLEILYLKLKEAKVGNTYHRTQEDTDMASKSLKNFAAKMLAEGSDVVEGGDVKSPADVHQTEVTMKVDNAEQHAADKAGAHAMKTTEPTVTLKTEAAKLEEELNALIAESEGEAMTAKDGEQDLAGAASSIPDKKVGAVDVTKSTSADSTNSASHVQGVKENVAVSAKALSEQAKKLKKENLTKQIKALQEQLKECGMEMPTESATGGAMDPNASQMPGTAGKHSVMGEEDTIINFNFDLADLVPELGGLGDEDEIEIEDDDAPMGGSAMDMGAGSSDVGASASSDSSDLDGSSEMSVDLGGSDDMGSDKGDEDKLPLAESKVLAENAALKTELAEQQLFNAKVVHVQPFLNNKNLTKEQKQKIVEFLDRGKSIDQVKSFYAKAKTVVENMQRARGKAGSSSKTASSGAASSTQDNTATKQENLFEGAVLVDTERNRLMELAGIKRK